MYRYRDKERGRGFVFGVRSAVIRDNDGESSSNKCSHAYTQNILRSFKHIESTEIQKCIIKQIKQVEYRNLFDELP